MRPSKGAEFGRLQHLQPLLYCVSFDCIMQQARPDRLLHGLGLGKMPDDRATSQQRTPRQCAYSTS